MESRDKQILDLAMEAGKTLLDAGAEIFRAEETIQRIAKAYGIEKCSAFVMSTGIFLTAESKGEDIYAQVRHIPINSARLNRVAAVNQLSREIVEGRYTVEEAWERLEAIKHSGIRRRLCQLLLCAGRRHLGCSGSLFVRFFTVRASGCAGKKREEDIKNRTEFTGRILGFLSGCGLLPSGNRRKLRKHPCGFHHAPGTRCLFCELHPGFCGR